MNDEIIDILFEDFWKLVSKTQIVEAKYSTYQMKRLMAWAFKSGILTMQSAIQETKNE